MQNTYLFYNSINYNKYIDIHNSEYITYEVHHR